MRTFPLALSLCVLTLIPLAMLSPLELAERAQVDVIRSSGADVVYVLPDATRHPLKALVGSTEQEEQSSGTTLRQGIQTRTTDFVIPTADLPSAPTRSVLLEFAGGSYRPASLAGEPLSRDSGRHGLITRIHTTRVGDA